MAIAEATSRIAQNMLRSATNGEVGLGNKLRILVYVLIYLYVIRPGKVNSQFVIQHLRLYVAAFPLTDFLASKALAGRDFLGASWNLHVGMEALPCSHAHVRVITPHNQMAWLTRYGRPNY